jgi:rod shape-determining protein MreD
MMPDFTLRGILRMAMLALLSLLAVTIEVAPLGLSATALPGPDLLFCVVAVWALRRPRSTPLLLVFALGVMRDLATDLPAGLGALTLVAASEILRRRSATLARQPFPVEFLWVATLAAGMMLAQWLGVLISLARPPYLSLLLQQFTATLLVYPAVLLVCRWGLGLRGARSEPSVASRERDP